jgi:hypothetical protein
MKMVRSPPWLGWPLWNVCVTNDHGYVPLVVSTSRSFPHSRLITGFVTRLTRWVPLVDQELPILPEHLSMFCWSLFVLLYFSFGPLCCLFFFDIRFLIAPLVSSNSSYSVYNCNKHFKQCHSKCLKQTKCHK